MGGGARKARGVRQCLPAVAAIAALLFGTGLIVPAAAQGTAPPVVLVYTEQDGEASILHTFVIEPISSGYAIELTSRGGGAEILQRLRTCPAWSVESWYYRDLDAGTEIQGVREPEAISLRGRHKGLDIRKTLSINAGPWYQLFFHCLERLDLGAGTGTDRTVRFWAVGVEGIGAMRAGSFRAAVSGVEEVLWQGRAVEAVRVRISLAGPASILWRGDYWYRPGDGRNLISRSDRGPGSRWIRIELTAER